MYAFAYHRPGSLQDALRLSEDAAEPKFLAGGQTLIPTMKQRLNAPSDVIDLGRIDDLKGISVGATGVAIGAGTRHAQVAFSADVKRAIPALAQAAELIGDPVVRNLGTLGGSIANNDPAADYPAVCLGLGATIVTNRREIAADDFFTGMFETALAPHEIITKVVFPVPEKAAYEKFRNPASRYALVGVFVAKTQAAMRVAVTGAGSCVFRQRDMEAALATKFEAASVARIKQSPDGMNSDLYGSAEYRAHLVTVMAKRAVAAAAGC